MKKVLLAVLFAFCAASVAHGQNTIAVSGSHIQELDGTLLTSGSICFQGTDQNDRNISFQQGGGGPVITTPICKAIASGAFVTFNVPNPANTSPANVRYHIQVKQGARVVGDFPGAYLCLASGACTSPYTFDFDNCLSSLACVANPIPIVTAPAVGPTGPTGATGPTGTVTDNSGMTVGGTLIVKGPSPYADITAFGARAVGTTVYPHTTVDTSGCIATSTTVGIVSATSFADGDYIALFGCGYIWNGAGTPQTAPSAPTVTNVIAAAGTGLGGSTATSSLVVTDGTSTGATTMNYKVIACDKYGGCTAASSAATTTTSQATLGKTTCTINTETLAVATITVTFSAPCYVSAGTMVHITGTSAQDYPGVFTLATVNAGTYESMTITNTALSTTGLGGVVSASSTGGTMAFYYSNHLKWTPITNAWRYYIYADRANDGNYVLAGETKPSASNFVDVQFDDYGATYMGSQTYYPWIPTTPPASASADPLSAKIVSGAGTTSLVLDTAAITSSSGGFATFDDAPEIESAALSVYYNGNTAGYVYLPPVTNSGQLYGYPVFTYLTIPAKVNFKQAGPLLLSNTVEWAGNEDIDGSFSNYGIAQFGTAGHVENLVVYADPAFYVSGTGVSIHDMRIEQDNTNGGTLIVSDSISGPQLDRVELVAGGQGNSDYLSMCALLRSQSSGGTTYIWSRVVCDTGPNQVTDKSWTPAIYVPPAQNGSGGLLGNQFTIMQCDQCTWQRRGFEQEQSAGNGGTFSFTNSHDQGNITPFLLFGNSSSNASPYIHLSNVLLDTTSLPVLSGIGNGGSITAIINANTLFSGSSDVGGIPPPFSGHVPAHVSIDSSAVGHLPNWTASAGYFLSTPSGIQSPGVVVISGHANQSASGTWSGTCTLGTNCAITFGTAYSSAPVCIGTDQTSAAAVKAAPLTTGVTFTGTGTDVVAWACFGNPN